ncbi:MAG: hypothetical protein N0C90_22025 [Candidatus Thiodiazotropha endolucinida]|nr:hypothetical protein [Candidatus Thiodiazotropha endolucinida]
MTADFYENAGKLVLCRESPWKKAISGMTNLFEEGTIGNNETVTLSCLWSVRHDVACPNDWGDHVATLLSNGTIQKDKVFLLLNRIRILSLMGPVLPATIYVVVRRTLPFV